MKSSYPLKQLVEIKNRRLEEAEQGLKKAKEETRRETEKQRELEKERQQTAQHREDKLKQMRETIDQGTTSDQIKIMKTYLKIVDEELTQKQNKVEKQKKHVDAAKTKEKAALQNFFKKQHDVEKLHMHHKEWKREEEQEEMRTEEREADDISTSSHCRKKGKMVTRTKARKVGGRGSS